MKQIDPKGKFKMSPYQMLQLFKTSLLFFIGMLFLSGCNSGHSIELGTYEDPEVALKETQKVLLLLSKHVNTGYQSVHYINEYEITRDKIFNLK